MEDGQVFTMVECRFVYGDTNILSRAATCTQEPSDFSSHLSGAATYVHTGATCLEQLPMYLHTGATCLIQQLL